MEETENLIMNSRGENESSVNEIGTNKYNYTLYNLFHRDYEQKMSDPKHKFNECKEQGEKINCFKSKQSPPEIRLSVG